jgi:hypothetical protein
VSPAFTGAVRPTSRAGDPTQLTKQNLPENIRFYNAIWQNVSGKLQDKKKAQIAVREWAFFIKS